MLTPSFADFERLARNATLVPIAKTIPADLLTPVSAFFSIAAKERHAFLLESVEGGEKIGRYTFLGIRPYMTLTSTPKQTIVERGRSKQKLDGELLAELKRIFAGQQVAHVAGLPPFTSGAVGYFAYDAIRRWERLPAKAKDDLKLPDCFLMFFDRVLAFDHVRHEIHLIATADVRREPTRKAYVRAQRDIEALERQLARGARMSKVKARGKLRVSARSPQRKFLQSVAQVKDYISAGDVFQCVLSQRWELEPGVAPFEIYRALRTVNPSPYMYYLRAGETHVLGSSPEMLLKATGDRLEYRPIAGTQPRGRDEAEDARFEAHLRSDEKERAEHVMLVDLGRNDLGRVSQPGSVRVKDLMFVERYSHVMHMVSALEGGLRKDLTAWDAFAACFPAGTLTGAPKIRAMEIIDELEPVRRGIYGGAVLYADFAGNLDSCIAIRTMLMRGRRAYVQAGAGIVADSVPEREYDECMNKAQALLRAVERARSL